MSRDMYEPRRTGHYGVMVLVSTSITRAFDIDTHVVEGAIRES